MTDNGKIVFIAEHYGLAHQLMKTAEEASELAQAALKYLAADEDAMSGRSDGRERPKAAGHLVNEIADTLIMIDQILYLTGTEPAVRIVIDRKIERQMERIRQGKPPVGHWLKDEDGYCRCSECGIEYDKPDYFTPFCPACGMKMIGVKSREMMTFDDAISQLDDLIGDANTHCEEDGSLDEVFRRDIQAMRMGITALKAVKGGER